MSKLGIGNDIDKFTHYCLERSDILFHMQKIDYDLPHLPLAPHGRIQGRVKSFTAATPSVCSPPPTKAVQRGVVQKQRSEAFLSFSSASVNFLGGTEGVQFTEAFHVLMGMLA